MIHIITNAAATNKRNFLTYKFSTMEKARLFVNKWNLENRIIDILTY